MVSFDSALSVELISKVQDLPCACRAAIPHRTEKLGAKISFPVLSDFNLNLLKPTGHVMHHQFNIQQLYALPTLYLCVLCLFENKQRLVPLTA
jgi:hypothetical protein